MPLEWAYFRLGSGLRELERACHRQADLAVHGGEVELDKAIVEDIGTAGRHGQPQLTPVPARRYRRVIPNRG